MPLNDIEPSAGKLLIAEPFLQDYYFHRSVVLLTEHNEKGSMGFIINKPIKFDIRKVFSDFPKIDIHFFYGGPVGEDSLFFIHTCGNIIENSIHIFDNLYLGGSFELVKLFLETGSINPADIRFFIGYSGWSANQLNDELKQNSWLVSNTTTEFIFNGNHATLWSDAIKSLGGKYAQMANFPPNPSFN